MYFQKSKNLKWKMIVAIQMHRMKAINTNRKVWLRTLKAWRTISNKKKTAKSWKNQRKYRKRIRKRMKL
jgi:hypothetical protein